MTKQELLDKEQVTTQEWVMQALLTNMSKTELAQVRRDMARIYNIAYKTTARELKFVEIVEAVIKSEEIARNDKTEANALEIGKATRRRRDGSATK